MSFPFGIKRSKTDAPERLQPTAPDDMTADTTEETATAPSKQAIHIHYVRALEGFGHSTTSQHVQNAIFQVDDQAITLSREAQYIFKARAYSYASSSIPYALAPMDNNADEVVLLSESSLMKPFANSEGVRSFGAYDDSDVEYLRMEVEKVSAVRRDGVRYCFKGRVVFCADGELHLLETIKEN